jgi:hypothetical protein
VQLCVAIYALHGALVHEFQQLKMLEIPFKLVLCNIAAATSYTTSLPKHFFRLDTYFSRPAFTDIKGK